MEFIIGFFMGSAAKSNPVHTILGFVLTSLLLWMFIGVVFLVWHFAPQAADFIQWTGLTKFCPFLNIELHDNDWFSGGLIQALVPRIQLCAIGMMVITSCFVLACYALKGMIWAVVKAVRLMRAARKASV